VRVHRNEPLRFEKTGPRSWWHLLKKLRTDNGYVNVVSYGVKIWHLRPFPGSPWNRELLSEPILPSKSNTLKCFDTWPKHMAANERGDCRFLPLAINAPDPTGYSFCFTEHLINMHAHQDGQNMEHNVYQDFKELMQSCHHWVHLPIGRGEYISEVWWAPGNCCMNGWPSFW